MPPRSHVLTRVPAHVRKELERRLVENGFRDYERLAQWLRGEGYNISDDSLWRYGRSLQQQMLAARLSALPAATLAELPDSGGAIAQTLLNIAQQKALATLVGQQGIKPAVINTLARMIAVAQGTSAAASASFSASTADDKGEAATGPAAQASQSTHLNNPSHRGSTQLNPSHRGSTHFNPSRPGSTQPQRSSRRSRAGL
jgi:phosphohistidine phosphatase SixA